MFITGFMISDILKFVAANARYSQLMFDKRVLLHILYKGNYQLLH